MCWHSTYKNDGSLYKWAEVVNMKYWQTWHDDGSADIETTENEIIETLEAASQEEQQTGSEQIQQETEGTEGENVETVESVQDQQDSALYDHLEEIEKNSIASVYLLAALLLFTILKSLFSGVTR